MRNDAMLPEAVESAALQPGQQEGLPRFSSAALWALMERQTALYTGMESSSVPVETAVELLEAVLFCVRTAFTECGTREMPLEQWHLTGQRILYQRQQLAWQLQQKAEKACLPLDNGVYRETLEATRAFFTWYDIRFLAHQIPAMIDYPLALPVSEDRKGIDYIYEYLRRRLWEDHFCGSLPITQVRAALHRHHPEWEELPLNLFEPVFGGVLGGAVLQQETVTMELPPEKRRQLRGLLRGIAPGELEQQLEKAAARLCNRLHIWGSAQRAYYGQYARTLAPRILAADEQGLAGIFV